MTRPKAKIVRGRRNDYVETVGRIDIVAKIMNDTFPEYIDGKLKKPMSTGEACKKNGISQQTFCTWMREDSDLNRRIAEIRESRRKMVAEQAEVNIHTAISGGMDLRDDQVIDASFRFLEKTNKEYQPTAKLDVRTATIDLTTPMEELIRQANELAGNSGT